MTPLIRANNLCVDRGAREVLKRLQFEFLAGEFVALLGLNGAGKSTLMEALAGLLGYSGSCAIEGRELRAWQRRELSRVVSFLPQTSVQPAGVPVRQVVAMGRYPHSGGWTESPEDRLAIAMSLETCQCTALAARRFSDLSGGERQRVLLAAALAQETPVLALDEPSAHADLPLQARMFELLRARVAAGALCLAVVHDINLALTFATRAVLLHEGAIVFDGDPRAMLEAAAFREAFGPDIAVVRDGNGNPIVTYRRSVAS
ncbi:MAG: ABC transporter ATP-binding protein [Candidatus Solibacter usitatus]|nr:ABC transporter ATP-binding protein [Candidatus Solibacter usitatus]